MKSFGSLLAFLLATAAHPAHAIETRPACITVNDVQIVSGEEKTVQKQLCRSAGSARYDVVVDSTYASASTQSAFDRASDPALRAARGQIEAMRGQVQAGQASNDTLRAELSRAQQDFVARLAEKDRAYAAEIAVFRGKLVDITKTERGIEALAKIAAGDVAGGDAIFNELTAANDLAVAARSAIERAKPRRDHAVVMLNERNKGRWPTEKVIALFQEVVALDPGVFWDWIDLARLYQDAGRLREAAGAVGRARQTAQSDRDRMVALNDLGQVLVLQGDLARADAAYAECLVIARNLAAADRGNAVAQSDVSGSLGNIGDVRVAQGDLARADAAYTEALTIDRKLAAADPGNAQAQRDVSISLNRIGDVRVVQGDLVRADAAYAEALTTARKLAAADPGNAKAQRDVSLDLNRIGTVREAQGDLAHADEAYAEGLAIARKLAAADPGNTEVQRDVSFSLNRIGTVRTAQGDLVRADAAYTESLVIRRKLAAADPGNAQAQRDVSSSLTRIGSVREKQGELAHANAAYAESLAIRRKLAAAHPNNALDQRAVWLIMYLLARLPNSGIRWSDVVAQMEAMEARSVLRPTDRSFLDEARAKSKAQGPM